MSDINWDDLDFGFDKTGQAELDDYLRYNETPINFPSTGNTNYGDVDPPSTGRGGPGTSYTQNPDGTVTVNPDTGGGNDTTPTSDLPSGLSNIFNSLFGDGRGGLDLLKLGAMGGGLAGLLGGNKSSSTPSGYQGSIPKYTATRNMVTAPEAGRRPGAGGTNYGGDVTFAPKGSAPTGGGLASLVGGNPGNAPPSIAPPNPPAQTIGQPTLRDSLGAPIERQLVDEGNPFYQSPEYKAFQNDPSNMMGTNDMYMSPYFGRVGSGSAGRAMDAAFEQYRKRTSAPGMAVKPGQPTKLPEVAPREPDGGIITDFEPPMLTPAQQARSIITETPDMLSGFMRDPNSNTLTGVTPKEVNTPPEPRPEPRPELMRELMGVSNPRQYAQTYAQGGIANLGGYSDGGRLLRGPGDGVSDDIPATIGGRQPARLADGEFVVPARIVSELGNGSTEAGARKLYAMMDRIKASRAKAKNIAADTKASKHLPA